MRIAHWVRAGDKYGSLEKYLVAFSGLCADRGYSFSLMSEIENTSQEYRTALSQNKADWLTVGESARQPLAVFRTVARFVRTRRPDVVHLHFINPIAVPFLKLLGVPLVYQTYHSGIEHRVGEATRLIRWINNSLATHIYAVSQKVKRDEIRAGVSPHKISVSYLGLPFELFHSLSGSFHEPLPPFWDRKELRKIITVGRFFPIKGMRYVIDAAVQVLHDVEDVVWWVVGKRGPDSVYCEERVRDAGLSNRVFFLGERNDVPALLGSSYLQVIGSLHEGFGLMALEAAALGIPSVGTKIEGLDEVILDGRTGLLVLPRSGEALAEAVFKLLSDRALWEQMSSEAQKYAVSRFDSEKSISLILDNYKYEWKRRYKGAL